MTRDDASLSQLLSLCVTDGIGCYHPPGIILEDELCEPEATPPSNHDDLEGSAEASLAQMLVRAHKGDEECIESYARVVRKAVRGLERLFYAQKGKLKVSAQSASNWPVLLSKSSGDWNLAKTLIDELNVGATGYMLRTQGQKGRKINRRHPWTALAILAIETCRRSGALVSALDTYLGEGKEVAATIWGKTCKAMQYDLGDRRYLIIPQWLRDSASLTDPISKTWLPAIRACVYEHWWHHQDTSYEAALTHVGNLDKSKSERRNDAMKQVEKAFLQLAKLPPETT